MAEYIVLYADEQGDSVKIMMQEGDPADVQYFYSEKDALDAVKNYTGDCVAQIVELKI